MKKIAMCIPTKNRPETVSRVLKVGARIYSKYPLDIFYYDTSDNDETEKIIRQYQSEYENIHYIRFDSELGPRKMIWIYAGYGREGSYDYIWPVKDRKRFFESALDAIFDAAEAETDVIFLGSHFRNQRVFHPTETYQTTPTELYRDWGWRATSMDAVIYYVPTMIGEDFTIERCEQECFHEYNINWLQPFWLFNRLAALPDSTIRVLAGQDAASVEYQWGKSEWEQRIFKVWEEEWIKVNEGLPDIYDAYKDKVILEGASIVGILGSVDRVKELFQSGILTANNLEDVLVDWERVSNVPPAIVRDIVYGIDERHDVSLLRGKRGDTADFIIKIIEMLKDGKIAQEQVPYEKIQNYMIKELSLQSGLMIEEQVLLRGTLDDIGNCMKGATDAQYMQNLLQCQLALLSLMARADGSE